MSAAPRWVVRHQDGRYWDLGWYGWFGPPSWVLAQRAAARFTNRRKAAVLAKRFRARLVRLVPKVRP